VWAAISCWADAAHKETARGAALGTRWAWPATAESASAPSATRTGTATPWGAISAALTSATAAAAAAAPSTEDELMDDVDDSLSQLYYSLYNLGFQKIKYM
jgi:hypothetical protein